MARLKSREQFPPHGFQLLLPEIGMTTPVSGSFAEVVDAFARIVAKNPSQAQKYGWPVDRKGQEDFIDEREAQRMIAQGWAQFVNFGTPLVYPAATVGGVKKNWRGAAAAVINGGKAAYASYREMFGPTGPVGRELAEKRAEVCAGCPQNDVSGGLPAYFLESTAKGIMALIGALKDLNVYTTKDDKLGVCKACMCPMRAKVFTPLSVIVENMPEPVWPQLQKENPKCWILSEANR